MDLQERFINKLKEKYGDRYDYSLVEYKSPKEKVKIICKKHNLIWEVSATHLLAGQECPECTKEKHREKLKQEFIRKAKELHGDKYDYSKVEYINKNTPVTIICPEYGEFKIKPSRFLKNKKVGDKKIKNKISFENFIKKATEIHINKYQYDKDTFVNMVTKMKIVCPIHGEFWQKPSDHLQGKGCKECQYDAKRLTREQFIEKARQIWGDRFDYSKVIYEKSNKKVCVICPEHGEFWVSPNNHLRGKSCPYCAGKYKTTDSIIKEFKQIHGNKYDYSKVVYTKAISKVCIICPEHGEFWMSPNKHLGGECCPNCKKSKLEIKVGNFLTKNNIKNKNGYHCKWLALQHLDYFLPDYNIAIECQGIQHFESLDIYGGEKGLIVNQERDERKYKLCKENGIKLLYYAEDDRFIAPDTMFGEKIYKNLDELKYKILEYAESRVL